MKKRRVMLCSAIMGLFVGLSGCKVKEEAPPPQKVEETVEAADISYAWRGFPQPAPTPQSSKILIEKRVPRKIRPNQEFSFTIDVRNNADFAVSELRLTETLPQSFKLSKATVTPEVKNNTLIWNLGNFRPGQKRQIMVTGTVSASGAARFSGRSDLDFALGDAVSVVEAINPELNFSVSKLNTAIVNEDIPVKLNFKNAGKAPVEGVRLVHTLPQGLLTSDGRSRIDLNIGDLDASEARVINMTLRGNRTGDYKTVLTAVANEGISAKADMAVKVTEPKLEISGKAPRKRFVGNVIPYEIDVKNVGDAITQKVVVRMELPEGASPVAAGEDGIVKGQNLFWEIKTLHPGERKKLVARVIANKIMMARVVASAETNGSKPVEVAMVTDIAGIAAILGTLVDKNDPVPVGGEEIYELTVTNQGSLPATKVEVVCVLEDSMEYVKSTGATKGAIDGNKLIFDPLAALPPQANAVWRINVKALKEGDVRFTVYIKSDQLQRPVELLESTHFYK
ncbi:MAG: DUF11 domain-containing protein [Victivallales bacterium]|nr:DUF11 domain-containing protein [Victivallales bacterium]